MSSDEAAQFAVQSNDSLAHKHRGKGSNMCFKYFIF